VSRDRRIDTFRGLLLVVMTIDHFGGFLSQFTKQPLGYVSAAEGFVFLSGFVCMEAYGKGEIKSVFTKTFKRSLKVYKYHIFLFFLLPLISILIPQFVDYWRSSLAPYYSNPVLVTFFGLLLLQQPRYMDILPMYSIFLAFFPVYYFFLKSKKVYYTWILLLVSFFIWILGQFFDPILFLSKIFSKDLDSGSFNIFAWQFVFVLGIFSSNYKESLLILLEKKYIFYLILLSVVSFCLFRHYDFEINRVLLGEMSNFPVHRLINFVLVGFFISYFLTKFDRSSYVPILEYLGKNSLQVFSAHVVFLYLFMPLVWRVNSTFGDIGNTAFHIFVVFFLFLFAYFYNNFYQNYIVSFFGKGKK
jgi:hypothetical protein